MVIITCWWINRLHNEDKGRRGKEPKVPENTKSQVFFIIRNKNEDYRIKKHKGRKRFPSPRPRTYKPKVNQRVTN